MRVYICLSLASTLCLCLSLSVSTLRLYVSFYCYRHPFIIPRVSMIESDDDDDNDVFFHHDDDDDNDVFFHHDDDADDFAHNAVILWWEKGKTKGDLGLMSFLFFLKQ